MKIIDPYVQILDASVDLRKIEYAGRTCYKSAMSSPDDTDRTWEFIRKIIERGHESVIEHETITVKVVCDRGVSHEIVRHRIGSYSQESQRYCRYGDGVTFIKPFYLEYGSPQIQAWYAAMQVCENAYLDLLRQGLPPEQARCVLPNSTKTEIVITYNLREWRHFLKLRCSPRAHPQMRQITIPLLLTFKGLLSSVFLDIDFDIHFPPRYYARVFFSGEVPIECCWLIDK